MYDKVIVALDLSDSSQLVIDKAVELVGGDISKLSLAQSLATSICLAARMLLSTLTEM